MTASGYRILIGSDANDLKLDCGDVQTTLNVLKTVALYVEN